LPYDSAIVLLGIYSKEMKMHVYTKICSHMLVATLFIFAQLGSNQDEVSEIHQWSYIWTLLKINELSSHNSA
jgi:hypothetical protein